MLRQLLAFSLAHCEAFINLGMVHFMGTLFIPTLTYPFHSHRNYLSVFLQLLTSILYTPYFTVPTSYLMLC